MNKSLESAYAELESWQKREFYLDSHNLSVTFFYNPVEGKMRLIGRYSFWGSEEAEKLKDKKQYFKLLWEMHIRHTDPLVRLFERFFNFLPLQKMHVGDFWGVDPIVEFEVGQIDFLNIALP